MTVPSKLTPEERAAVLRELPDWQHDAARDALVRAFTFADFSEAFAFMTRVALLAERHDHHPDWHNVYNRVTIALSTHDVGGLSARDLRMARAIEALMAR